MLSRFHPAVSAWFNARFGAPTEVQARAWEITEQGGAALITAPTGSGKTLAAFLAAINDLVVTGLREGLRDEVYVLYVSPLKALSNDIQKNLQEPLCGIRDQLLLQGIGDVPIRDAVRTGDTSQVERERMRRSPPHILVTTPESLFILLSSDSGRAMLANVRSVIIDELHAVAGSKRGSHLMLTLERLDALCARPPVRVGLSATVKPLDAMARFLMGANGQCAIVDGGHIRIRDLALEVPESPLEAVMSNEVWGEVYDRLARFTLEHRTTLIFVNQRRIAERVARHLAERIGEEHVTAHHGSLAREHRLKAEQRLKNGELKALVATSSLELGIDIGQIDLVCQLGSPRSIAAFLQRVGRAGHAIGAIPKGRLFPLTLDDLLESTALLAAVNRGELDRIHVPVAPLDVLAQQIIAEVGCREWGVDELYDRFRRATPYANLVRDDYAQVVQMLADGYATRRGRRGAYLHFDAVNGHLRARRGARLTAVTNGGVIPDQFDYEVVLMPEEHRVGTLNEDFAFDSIPGDIFQLGNASYRIQKVETGKVYVADAKGLPPTLPFWLGEALGRTDELSASVSALCAEAQVRLGDVQDVLPDASECQAWLTDDIGLQPVAALQLAQYLASAQAALGALPTHDTIILERFFDDVGDTHLVIHSPFGSRINKAWGLALRKRFCRQFNFELQASALEDSIVLSLGPTHSFPLDEIRNYLKSATAKDILVQALLDAPMFGTRWRWNASVALAVKRMNGGKRVPPQFQRADSEDLLTVIFPDSQACAENLTGEREIPDHPLVRQTLDDCLHVTLDVDGFLALLGRIERGEIKVLARDLAGPSPLSHAILAARPYSFLDDGDAEARRTRSVSTQRLMEPQTAADLGQLDPAAIARVREEAKAEATNADELHDALVVHGFLTDDELDAWRPLLAPLQAGNRVLALTPRGGEPLWIAAERAHEFAALFPEMPAPLLRGKPVDADVALREIIRNRLELLGPVTEGELAAPLGLAPIVIRAALLALEHEGAVMRGGFTAPDASQWCERRLLARIHRYTRERKRAEIQPLPPTQFLRFLFRWQHLAGDGDDDRLEGEHGLLAALQQLEGFSVPASAWEDEVLAPRIRRYAPEMLDKLCSSGRIVWSRPGAAPARPAPATVAQAGAVDGGVARRSGPVKATPILLCERENLPHWQAAAAAAAADDSALSPRALRVRDALAANGASFIADLAHDSGLLRTEAEEALGELVSHGLVTSDSFAGLRALVAPAERHRRERRWRGVIDTLAEAGRWALARTPRRAADTAGALAEPHVEHIARVLLRRYGVVFRRLLDREDHLPPWRELFYVYRRLEARGEIRGGRFVSGFSGEQFALPDAALLLRKVGRDESRERVSICAADPLNLAGILTPGERVPAVSGNRVLFEAGVPVAVQAAGEVRYLKSVDARDEWEIRNLLIRRQQPASYFEPPGAAQ